MLGWLTAAASLVGVWLNIHRRRACFVVWGATNAVWAVLDLVHGIPSQAALQVVYFGLSIYGWIRWKPQ